MFSEIRGFDIRFIPVPIRTGALAIAGLGNRFKATGIAVQCLHHDEIGFVCAQFLHVAECR